MDEQSIFLRALDTPAGEPRAAWLDEVCGIGSPLRERIDALLGRHEQASSFLEGPAAELGETISPDASGDNLAASLEAGLAPAFGEDKAVVVGSARHSVLKMLAHTIDVPRVVLRESTVEGADPIQRPTSPEIPKPGSDSRYQLQGEIARGGMGAIIKGRDTDLGRELAIKVLLDQHKARPEVIQRFIEEAQISGQLQHPGITPVYELGQFADKRPFFSMKLVKGETLAKLLAARENATEDRGRFIGIFEHVCQTMAYAHSRGVIHRDLKPANIMVGSFGEVQVMDWGLAKVLPAGGVADEKKLHQKQQTQSIIQTLRSGVGSDSPAMFGSAGSETRAGSVMGTPAYMPPEQALGEIDNMDERADVFGLGAILCEILTGKPPYVADDGAQIYRMASRGKLEDCFARLEACGADNDLVALTKHCLELELPGRPRDASALAEGISGYLESAEIKLRETEMAKVAVQARAEESVRRHKLVHGAGAAVTMSLVIGIAASVWQTVRADREATRAGSAEQRAVDALDELRATAPAFAEQARSLAAKERFEEALEKLDYAVKLQPDVPEYLVAKADLLQCQLRLAEAAAMYREALRVQPGISHAEASAKLCDELLAAKPTEQGKLTRESLARLHLAMQRQQRPAAELMPIAGLLGEEKKLLVEYWLARLEDLPVSAERPLKDRLTVRDDGRLALDLSDTKVLDLSPLAGAPLAALNLSGIENRSELMDLAPLSGLALVELNVSRTEVADLAPLREMHTLEKLNLAGSKVTDIAPLDQLHLKSLSFQGCPITDLTPICKMPLEEISVRQTRVADLSPLIGMPIKRVDLGEAPVLDFSPLAELPLENCYLHDNRITDLSVLRDKPLKELVLWGCNAARNFAAIADIETLELLVLPSQYRTLPDVDYEAIGSLRGLPRLQQLGTEYIGGMGYSAAGVLRRGATSSEYTGGSGYAATSSKDVFWQDWDREQSFLPALRKNGFNFTLTKLPTGFYALSMSSQPISDLSMLQGAPISQLSLVGCVQVSDLTPIQGMPLTLLNAFGNSITDLSPLHGMPLERVFLTGTQVKDLSPLAGLPVKYLYLDSCRNVTDISPLAEISTLEHLVVPIQAKNVETLRSLPRLKRLGYKSTGDAPMLPDTTAAEFWKKYEPGLLLKPATVAIWDFDSGSDGWRPLGFCELSTADGALRVASTGAVPRIVASIPAAPADWSVFRFRARSNEELVLHFFWSTTTHRENGSFSRQFVLGATGKDWQDYYHYFRADGDLTQLRLDPRGRAGQQMEFDWIRLERSNEEALRTVAGELVQRVEQGSSTAGELTQLAQLLEALDGDSGLKRYQEILTTGIEAHPDRQPLRAARDKLHAGQQQ